MICGTSLNVDISQGKRQKTNDVVSKSQGQSSFHAIKVEENFIIFL